MKNCDAKFIKTITPPCIVGNYKILEQVGTTTTGFPIYKCLCLKCDKIINLNSRSIRKYIDLPCTHKLNNIGRLKDFSGLKFGKLTVVRIHEIKALKRNVAFWECKCDCGGKKIVSSHGLVSGSTKSCGCLIKEINRPGANKKPNEIIDYGDYYGIILNNTSNIAFIDKQDLVFIKYGSIYESRNGYATLHYLGKERFLHRIIFNMADNYDKNIQIDHINHNRLDNRRCNLRVVSPYENAFNAKKKLDNKIAIKHRNIYPSGKSFKVSIGHKGKYLYLGVYKTLEQALKVRDEFVKSTGFLYGNRDDYADNSNI